MGIKFGLEVELIADEELKNFNVAGYHHGRYSDFPELNGYWKIERDGSLSPDDEDLNKFLSPKIGEFITKKLAISDLPRALNAFKKFFEGDEYELNEVISFNSSCGCHIHFSEDVNVQNGFLTYTNFDKLRENTFKRIAKDVPDVFESFKNHYFRPGYSNKNDSLLIPDIREVEFNFTQLKDNRGIEWRAFNLRGVKTWAQFFKMITIAIEEIQKMFNEYIKSGEREILELEIPEELIEVYSAMNQLSEV